jgi:hypothetical protein
MFYKFDPDQLQLVKDFKKFYISLTTVLILVALTFIIGRLTAIKQLTTLEKELIVIDLRAEDNKYNKDISQQAISILSYMFEKEGLKFFPEII